MKVRFFFNLLCMLVMIGSDAQVVKPLPAYLTMTAQHNPFRIVNKKRRKQQAVVYHLHYHHVKTVQQMLLQAHLLKKSDIMVVDVANNLLWVDAGMHTQASIGRLLKAIDQPPRELEIKAKIVDVNTRFVKTLGVNFGTTQVVANQGRFATLMLGGFHIGQFNLAVTKLAANALLWLQLSALEKEGRGQVIASPNLLTENRHSADIESGDEIPYQEKTGQGNTTIAFKKAVLRLKVTPEIEGSNHVLLKIMMNQDKVSPLTVVGVPAIDTREIHTDV